MKKITFQEFEKAVREAKAYVNNYDKVRWKIVDICLRVCDTSKGGRKTEEIFSIHKFSEAIELNPKTLYEWIKIKTRVVDKLPATELKNKASYSFSDLADVSEKVNSDFTKKEVLQAWREQLSQPLEARKFVRYTGHLKSILYNAQRPLNLMLVDIEIIKKIESMAGLISKFLKKEIELRKKISNEKRLTGRESQIASAIKESQDFKTVGK